MYKNIFRRFVDNLNQFKMTQVAKAPMQVKDFFGQDQIKSKFNELLGKRSTAFMTSVLQIVSSNSLLKNADPISVYQAAATAATLDLPLNNNIGFAYIVPYKQRDGSTLAQFQMGYKGFIQLAQRSGQFKTLSSCPVYDGQLVEENPLTGFVFDWKAKKSDNIIGYAAYFELLNGFQKTLYMTKAEVEKHGKKYSKTYANGPWSTDFDGMAQKTLIKLLLSKFAPLSVEMQTAQIADQAVIKDFETMEVGYIDNEPEMPIDKEEERIKAYLAQCETQSQLDQAEPSVPVEYLHLVEERAKEIEKGSKK